MIVVLAIIALIAVPIVLNIIEQARQGAAESSARSYIKATETYIVSSELNKKDTLLKNNKYNVTKTTTIEEKTYPKINDLVEIKGTKPSGNEDYIALGDSYNVIEARLTINGYEILIENNEVISIAKGKIVEVDSIILDNKTATIEIGETLELTATLKPDNASNKTVEWSSSNDEVATVSSNGLVVAKGVGTVVITATTSNKKSSTVTITVDYSNLSSVVSIGDYVAYDAGTWVDSAAMPTSHGEFGGYTKGANKSDTLAGCYKPDMYYSVLKGWRVLKIENNQVYLVHAGISECYYYLPGVDTSDESITNLNNRANSEYLNAIYAKSAHILTYDEAVAITGDIGFTDNNLRYIGPSGTSTNSALYWLSSKFSDSRLFHVSWNHSLINEDAGGSLGIRPVIVLKEGIKTTGKGKDIFNQEAWTLLAP